MWPVFHAPQTGEVRRQGRLVIDRQDHSSWHAKISFRHLNMECSSTLYTLMPYTIPLRWLGRVRSGWVGWGDGEKENAQSNRPLHGLGTMSAPLLAAHSSRMDIKSLGRSSWSQHVTRLSITRGA